MIRQNDLNVYGAHVFGIDLAEDHVKSTAADLIAIAKEFRLEYYVLSLAPTKISEVSLMIKSLNILADTLKDAGIPFLYHNHQHEFSTDQGELILDYIMREVPSMGLQLDVGWVTFAGYDPLEYMDKYAERIKIIHFKDISSDACEANRDDCNTAVGEGIIALEDIIEASKSLKLLEQGFVIDQDSSKTDMIEDIAVSCRNIKAGKCISHKHIEMPFDLTVWSMSAYRDNTAEGFRNLMQACPRLGVHFVDLMEPEIRYYGLDTVKHILAITKVRVNCYIIVVVMDKCIPDSLRAVLRKELHNAKELNASELMIVPYGVCCTDDPAERKGAADEIVKCFRIALEEAASYGIQVCVEDTPDYRVPLSSAQECKYVLDRVPGLKLVFDTANMLPAGDDPIRFYEELKEYICHVHLKDVVYVDRGQGEPCANGKDIKCVPSGMGVIPIEKIEKMLMQDGNHKLAMIEYAGASDSSYAAHKKSLKEYVSVLTLKHHL